MDRNIFIFRFSSIGDVAIAAPLVRAYALANPNIKFTMVSLSMMHSMFEGIENLEFLSAKLCSSNKSKLTSLLDLRRVILSKNPTDVADLHNSLRSRFLRMSLSLSKINTAVIWKSRFKRKALARRYMKVFQPIGTMQRRYEKVFVDLGLKDLGFSKLPVALKPKSDSEIKKIGIAPFAQDKSRAWPLWKMEKVVDALSKNPDYQIYLFGGHRKEATILQQWQDTYPNVESYAGKHILKEELNMMRDLDLMISMDSANMHLASFVRTPVLSIWGGTHPYAGFYGWGQDPGMAVQIDMLCRPCSIYGTNYCFKKNFPCLTEVRSDMVLAKINSFFGESHHDQS